MTDPLTNTCARCGRIYDPEKPHDCADRTAFTHGLDLFYDPAVIPTAVPDCHTVIGGKLFRLERHGDLNRYGLVRVRPEENPDV